jgi:transposase InsO family protein
MAVAARGGAEQILGVIFHTDRLRPRPTPPASSPPGADGWRSGNPWGWVGSCFDNAAVEAFLSSLEWEVLSQHDFATTTAAQVVVLEWCYGFYNHTRRPSAAGMKSPINYESVALNGEAS